jgi:tetratricopeptide (TPR) repeat protein
MGAAAAVIARALLAPVPEPAFARRPQSVVVMPYHPRTSTDAERDLAAELAGGITRELNGWDAMRAATEVQVTAARRDRGIAEPALRGVADGLELARDLGVEALVVLTVRVRGDSVHAEVMRYDAATADPVGGGVTRSAAVTSGSALAPPLALAILGLDGLGVDPVVLRRWSSHPDALYAYVRGTERLEGWRLDQAEQDLRQAVALDSAFALALHRLAYTLHWQVVQGQRGENATRPEIARLSRAAVRHARGASVAERLLIEAFQHIHDADFVDFAAARVLLDSLLAGEPEHAHGRLMRAVVEVEDRWLEPKQDGTLAPRGNLNEAVRAFTGLLRHRPDFDLGYGHLGSIYRDVVRLVSTTGGCSGFERPRPDLLVGWEAPTPEGQIPFCPVALDSLVWLPRETASGPLRATAVRGAERVEREWNRLLHWWAGVSPRSAKPRSELAAVALDRRRRAGVTVPERIDSLARFALRYTGEALTLEGDTAPHELVWLGALHLGAGNVDSAIEFTERGLTILERRGELQPWYAANAFLAAGQPTRALEIVGRADMRQYIPDPSDGHLIAFGGAKGHIDRARVLGAAGVVGSPLRRELEAIVRVWRAPEYTARERAVLRGNVLDQLAIPLSLDRDALDWWLDGSEPASPLWQVLLLGQSDPASARAQLRGARDVRFAESDGTYEAFLLGRAASQVGDHALAVQQFARLDSIPLRLDVLKTAWGFRALSYLLRAEAYHALGRSDSAAAYAERFIGAWTDADSLARPLVERARRSLERARAGG